MESIITLKFCTADEYYLCITVHYRLLVHYSIVLRMESISNSKSCTADGDYQYNTVCTVGENISTVQYCTASESNSTLHCCTTGRE